MLNFYHIPKHISEQTNETFPDSGARRSQAKRPRNSFEFAFSLPFVGGLGRVQGGALPSTAGGVCLVSFIFGSLFPPGFGAGCLLAVGPFLCTAGVVAGP